MADSISDKKKSVLPVVGLVIGIFALLSSWMPIVNNASFFIGVIGLIVAVIGLIKDRKNPKVGNGLAIVAIVINVLAMGVVLATQGMYSSAIDEATSGVSVSSSQEQGSEASGSNDSKVTELADYSKMKVGQSVTLDDGLVVRVKAVKTGLVDYDGSKVTCVTVTYKNSSDEKVSFDSYDWKAENKKGTQRDTMYFGKQKDELSYGELKKGGSVTGNVYFKGVPVRIVYDPVSLGENQDIGWKVK